ncbi:b(0,+)-type amino acid transporter 1 [Colletotrichum orbiculare MAFF 240422]|uniref:B(0,+)-type amino acid transporter 1 n=1 Tax=Colletotrichum orbiculare (strain 104-T / ATCC 96160 / CBS 514.97 / LARS 414 / MAFF 240422) TaxID=1213857 RepID=A0A484G1W3_COLOR|nr:b(0,+)-type amino acid transporter 1 [Colletotrichum orbiculare MAFF 240422]
MGNKPDTEQTRQNMEAVDHLIWAIKAGELPDNAEHRQRLGYEYVTERRNEWILQAVYIVILKVFSLSPQMLGNWLSEVQDGRGTLLDRIITYLASRGRVSLEDGPDGGDVPKIGTQRSGRTLRLSPISEAPEEDEDEEDRVTELVSVDDEEDWGTELVAADDEEDWATELVAADDEEDWGTELVAADETDDSAQRPLLAESVSRGEYGATEGPDRTAHSEAADERGVGTFTRNLGAVEAFAIVISIVIGSGVFTSPGSIDTNVPSPGAALVVWLVGGVLAWTGASTMAELGTAIPGEGGVQPFLQHIYGDVFGFLAAWTWIVAVMPATLAILAIVFVESIYSAGGVTDQAGALSHKLLSVLILIAMNGANCISTKASTRLNNLFVVTKFASIAAVVIAGLVVVILQVSDHDRDVGGRDWFSRPWFGNRNTVAPGGGEIDWSKIGAWDTLGYYSAALYGALWAYSGWDKAIYVTAELQAPARQLPLAINTAVPTIILCFIAANAAYYILLPWAVVSTTDSVAVTAINRLLGPGFGILAAILICLVVAGSLLGNSFVAGRMTVAAAKFNWLPRFLGFVGQIGFTSDDTPSGSNGAGAAKEKSDAPINALLLSTILSALYILFGNFRALLTFNGLGEYTFFFLTVLGAVILRVREPSLKRPYKPFVGIPVVFALVSGFVVVRGAIFAPVQALILIVLWLVGLGFYYGTKWYARRQARTE